MISVLLHIGIVYDTAGVGEANQAMWEEEPIAETRRETSDTQQGEERQEPCEVHYYRLVP